MTPLAYRITKELTLPVKQRSFNDCAEVLRRMADVHCFEITDVIQLVDILSEEIRQKGVVDARTSFLPAPKTWVEGVGHQDGARVGWLLEEVDGDRSTARVSTCIWGKPDKFGAQPMGFLRLGSARQDRYSDRICPTSTAEMILAFLAIINTPRIVGRRQHMPHRGLERRLVSMRGVIGKFPLHAWTEIKLDMTGPMDASCEGSHEAHYTGERALHFCRAHIRVRLGKLEIVRGHWRGDASLGIKQQRYKLVA